MAKNNNTYLFSFNEEELSEIYEGLVLRDELKKRLIEKEDANKDSEESPIVKKIANQFSQRQSYSVREAILDQFDDYIDNQVDDELMWQGIEEQLRKRLEE